MVSLRKEPQTQAMREITPIHMMDEEEAVRTYCPPKEAPANKLDIEIVVKQDNNVLLPAKSADVDQKKPVENAIKSVFTELKSVFTEFSGREWAEILIKSAFICVLRQHRTMQS